MANYYVDNVLGSDSNAGTSPGAGNAYATIQKGLDQLTATDGSIVYFKSGSPYSVATGLSFPSGMGFTGIQKLVGYTSTITDGGKPTIQASADSITILSINQPGAQVLNVIIDGNNRTGVRGVDLSGGFAAGLVDAKVMNCKNKGVLHSAGNTKCLRVEVTGCSTTSPAVDVNSSCSFHDGWVHDNTVTGISAAAELVVVTGNIVTNNTGASSVGIHASYTSTLIQNTVHGNGSHGIELASNFFAIQQKIQDNILTGNGGYGLVFASAPDANVENRFIDFNAFYNNTSGPRNNITAGPNDIALSADPYTNAAGNDFSLNNTAGGGAACRGVSHARPGGAISYHDVGALQHQAAGGGSTLIVVEDA